MVNWITSYLLSYTQLHTINTCNWTAHQNHSSGNELVKMGNLLVKKMNTAWWLLMWPFVFTQMWFSRFIQSYFFFTSPNIFNCYVFSYWHVCNSICGLWFWALAGRRGLPFRDRDSITEGLWSRCFFISKWVLLLVVVLQWGRAKILELVLIMLLQTNKICSKQLHWSGQETFYCCCFS